MERSSTGVAGHLSRRRFIVSGGRLVGAAVAAGAAPGLLGACADSSQNDQAKGGGLDRQQVAQARGSVKVLGWEYYEVPQSQPQGIKADWGYLGVNEDTITKTQEPGAFDLATIVSAYFDQLRSVDRIAPIDTSLIDNWNNVDEQFRSSEAIRKDGQVYGVPFMWGYGYVEYDADQVSEPHSLDDLMAPQLRQKVGIPDDPYAMIVTFAKFAGYDDDPTHLTQGQFDKTLRLLDSFKPQVRTIHQYGEEVQLLARGDIVVDFPAYGPSFISARDSGRSIQITLLEAFSYVDCFVLYKGAENLEQAYAYISQSLTPEAEKAVVTASAAFPVVNAAVTAVPKELRYESAGSILSQAPLTGGLPIEGSDEVVPFPDWVEAWSRFKS
jgi:spermidine/putrescine-binding protein